MFMQVSLYTFGAPRPGNHAFARDFISMVPGAVLHSPFLGQGRGRRLQIATMRVPSACILPICCVKCCFHVVKCCFQLAGAPRHRPLSTSPPVCNSALQTAGT